MSPPYKLNTDCVQIDVHHDSSANLHICDLGGLQSSINGFQIIGQTFLPSLQVACGTVFPNYTQIYANHFEGNDGNGTWANFWYTPATLPSGIWVSKPFGYGLRQRTGYGGIGNACRFPIKTEQSGGSAYANWAPAVMLPSAAIGVNRHVKGDYYLLYPQYGKWGFTGYKGLASFGDISVRVEDESASSRTMLAIDIGSTRMTQVPIAAYTSLRYRWLHVVIEMQSGVGVFATVDGKTAVCLGNTGNQTGADAVFAAPGNMSTSDTDSLYHTAMDEMFLSTR